MSEPVSDTVLRAVGVSKRYGDLTVVDNVSLDVRRGETICVIGPSGAGKSSFPHCLNMLEQIDEGQVYLDGELLGYREYRGRLRELPNRVEARQRQQIGMVFQQFNLFPHMTVLGTVTEAPVGVLRQGKAKARATARGLLAQVGLSDKADSYPAQLSGGQQQRVAIARALAMSPKVMLFDEPASALAPDTVTHPRTREFLSKVL